MAAVFCIVSCQIGVWKPLPMISEELVMAMKACGSWIRMKLRSRTA